MKEDIANILELIEEEKKRQNNEVCLIASENYVSKDILTACGSILTNKYAEGYPSKRYYNGCQYIDKIEKTAIDLAKKLFHCKYANVQPHSGSQANQAVYLALLQPGDTILGMDLDAGGHLTHGSLVSSSGKIYNSIKYGVDERGIINYEEIKENLYRFHPKLLIIGASAYPRFIDYRYIREIVDEYNKDKPIINEKEHVDIDSRSIYTWQETIEKCYIMVDMAHVAGLVATGLHTDPLPYADVVTATTHKTLRGPRGGIILTNDENLARKIDKAVFPGIQGGPLEHIIAGKAICFAEALTPEFKEYQKRVLENCKAMEGVFKTRGIDMVTGGSDNHLILLDLRKHNISGKELVDQLEHIGIIANANAIPNDPRPKNITSGIRIGTPAVTTRGFGINECKYIANIICDYIIYPLMYENNHLENLKKICEQYPVHKD